MLTLSRLSSETERANVYLSGEEGHHGWRVYHMGERRWWVRDQLCGFTQSALYIWFLTANKVAQEGVSHFDLSALRLIAERLNVDNHEVPAHQRLIVCFMPSLSDSEDVTVTLNAQAKVREALETAGVPRSYQVKLCLAKSGEGALARAISEQAELIEASIKAAESSKLGPRLYPHTFIDDWAVIPPGEVTGESDETWTIKHPIAMSQTAVTQALYKSVRGVTSPISNLPIIPATGTSWLDSVGFCNELSKLLELEPYYLIHERNDRVSIPDLMGEGIRLPTRAEWCYAASGGRSWPYAGSDLNEEVAWSAHNSGSKVHPVARLKHNDYGLYDMSGNLWEWCQEGPQDDEHELLCSGDHHPKWLLGGSWANHPWVFPIGETLTELPGYRDEYMGFRVARNLPMVSGHPTGKSDHPLSLRAPLEEISWWVDDTTQIKIESSEVETLETAPTAKNLEAETLGVDLSEAEASDVKAREAEPPDSGSPLPDGEPEVGVES